jgi:simple sugar transport system ATP-binding protein
MSTPETTQEATEKIVQENLVFMENICVHFGKVVALDNVNFRVKPNEVVGLLGDNGAGKSTLIKSLNGYHQVYSGNIYFNGGHAFFQSPKDARDAGIETAYQHLALVDLMSISRNFFMGRELITKLGPLKFLNRRKMDEISAQSLAAVGLRNIREMHEAVNFLSGGERQAIAIGRATHFGAKLLILDEPTAALSVMETEWVLKLISEAKNKGLAVIFISHNAYEVYEVADRFVVLQHGKNYAEVSRDETNPKELIEMIAGRK